MCDMSTRRTHTKSRTGCTNCKRRKCDECYPVCFNCKRHGVSCSLSATDTTDSRLRVSETLSEPSPATPGSSGGSNELPSAVDLVSLIIPPGSDQILPFPPQELWSRDLELMHHWCTITAQALAIREDMGHVWRVVMPREGYKSSYVMHGILSMAAAHKAYLTPSQRKTYLALSDYHQALGSEGFRSQLEDVNSDNWASVFCFASILVLYVLCLPARSEKGRLEDPIRNILELMGVVRGIRITLAPLLARVGSSEFAPMVYGAFRADAYLPEDYFPSLENTSLPIDLFEALRRLQNFQKIDIPSTSEVHYAKAVERLNNAAKLMASAGVHAEANALLAWPYELHESILIDIRAKKPHAVLVLGYLAIFFAAIEKSFWYCRGWAGALFEEVEKLLSGQPKFLELLEWPRRVMVEHYDYKWLA